MPLTLIRMQERSQLFIAITVTRFVVTATLSIVLVAIMDLGVRGALLANTGSAAGVLLVLLPGTLGTLRLRPSMPLLREMLRFGVPFFPVLLSGWFIEASDRYLLGLYRTKAEVGYYVLAYKVDRTSTDPKNYPILLVSYLMGCTKYDSTDTTTNVDKYFKYVESSEGQQVAASNAGSAPLPPGIVKDVQPALNAIGG